MDTIWLLEREAEPSDTQAWFCKEEFGYGILQGFLLLAQHCLDSCWIATSKSNLCNLNQTLENSEWVGEAVQVLREVFYGGRVCV